MVVDSHALFWFLSENPKLSRKARNYLQQTERIVVPSIVLMEILYLLERNNLSFKFVELLGEMRVRKYLVYPLDLRVIAQTLAVSPALEMHDRVIVATAQIFSAPLISKDREIRNFYPKTVW